MSESKKLSPPVTLTLSTGRQIFMSYGLLNMLASAIGSPENTPMVYMDMALQMVLIRTALGKFDPQTNEFQPASVDSELVMEDAEKVTHWIVEHVLDFFLRTLRQAKEIDNKFLPELANFKSTSNGSGT